MISNAIIVVYYLAFHFIAANPGSQSTIFIDLFLEPKKVSYGQFKGFDMYELSDFYVYHGRGKKMRNLYINRREKDEQLLYFKDTIADALEYHLKFFKSDEPKLPTVMMLDVENDISLGQHIFRITNKEATYCGFINFAADDYNFSSLGLHALIESVDDRILMSFNTEGIIDYAMDSLFDSSKVKFEIVRNNVIRLQ